MVTPLEQYLDKTYQCDMIADIWEQHTALLKLGILLRYNDRSKSIVLENKIPDEWQDTPTKRQRLSPRKLATPLI